MGYYCFKSDVGTLTTLGEYVSQMPAKTMLINGTNIAAYCLEHEKGATGGTPYTWEDMPVRAQDTVGTIMALGFQWNAADFWAGPSDNGDKWAVTQLLIWETINGHAFMQGDGLFGVEAAVDEDMEKCAPHAYNPTKFLEYYRDFKKRLNDYMKVPSFASKEPDQAKVITMKWDGSKYSATVTDADDFLVGVIDSKEDAMRIKAQIKAFVSSALKLELSEEKTLITNSEKRARFLGYDISVRRSLATKRDKIGRLRRFLYGTVCLEMPTEIMRKKLLEYDAMTIEKTVYGKDNWKAKSRYYLKDNDDLEILDQYNSEIRGFRNYYRIANNSSYAGSFGYIMQYSMFKTFATKYRLSMRKTIKKLRIGKNFGVHFTTKKGNAKTRLFYHDGFAREKKSGDSTIDLIPNTVRFSSKTSLMDRLSARQCELCGRTDVDIEIHHVRKLKDLRGKTYWERFMVARNRKTLALCRDCHTLLHAGKLS
jgi:hypothetical protein